VAKRKTKTEEKNQDSPILTVEDLLGSQKKLPLWLNHRTLSYMSSLEMIKLSEAEKYSALKRSDINQLVNFGLIRTIDVGGDKYISISDLRSFLISATSQCPLAEFYRHNFHDPAFVKIVSNFVKGTMKDSLWDQYYAATKRGRKPVIVDFEDFWKRMPRYRFFHDIQTILENQLEAEVFNQHKSICSFIRASAISISEDKEYNDKIDEAASIRAANDPNGYSADYLASTYRGNIFFLLPDFLVYGLDPKDFLPLIYETVRGVTRSRKQIHTDHLTSIIFSRKIIELGELETRLNSQRKTSGSDTLENLNFDSGTAAGEMFDGSAESDHTVQDIFQKIQEIASPEDFELIVDYHVKGMTYEEMRAKRDGQGSVTGISNKCKQALKRIQDSLKEYALDFEF